MRQRALTKSGGSSVTRALVIDTPVKASASVDKLVCIAGFGSTSRKSYGVFMRVNGTKIQLVTKVPEIGSWGPDKNVYDFATNIGAAYIEDFTILRVHYISISMVILVYQYPTSATALSSITIRPILTNEKTYNPTLVLGTATAISGATSATADVEAYLLRGLYGDIFNVRKAITLATGAYSLMTYVGTPNYSTPAVPASTNMVNVTSNISTYLPDISRAPCAKGGVFYKNASGVTYVNLIYNAASYKNITGATFSSSSIFDDNDCYILGLTSNGFVVIAYFYRSTSAQRVRFVVGHIEQNTGEFVSAGWLTSPLFDNADDAKILAFTNDTILYNNGKRQKIVHYRTNERGQTVDIGTWYNYDFKLVDLEPISVEHGRASALTIDAFVKLSPESDIFTGVFIYE